jgi:hypothetical protein
MTDAGLANSHMVLESWAVAELHSGQQQHALDKRAIVLTA